MKGVEEKKVKRELFLTEFEEGFENKSLKGKMTEILRRSSEELREFVYELGVSEKLPGHGVRLKSS
jgi:hypothetical protein